MWIADTASEALTDKIGHQDSSGNDVPVHAVMMPNFAKKKPKEPVIQRGVCCMVEQPHLSAMESFYHWCSPVLAPVKTSFL